MSRFFVISDCNFVYHVFVVGMPVLRRFSVLGHDCVILLNHVPSVIGGRYS